MTLWVPFVVVVPLCVEKFQLVGLTPAFAHCLCAHMVPLVLALLVDAGVGGGTGIDGYLVRCWVVSLA